MSWLSSAKEHQVLRLWQQNVQIIAMPLLPLFLTTACLDRQETRTTASSPQEARPAHPCAAIGASGGMTGTESSSAFSLKVPPGNR